MIVWFYQNLGTGYHDIFSHPVNGQGGKGTGKIKEIPGRHNYLCFKSLESKLS